MSDIVAPNAKGFDITDPKQWNALPEVQKIATITEMQSYLVIGALRHTSIGKTLIDRRAAGQKLTHEILLIEHREEPTVDAKTRRKMAEAAFATGESQDWRPRLYPLSGQPPKGSSKLFNHWFKMAKKYPPRPGTDMHCIIASDKKVFLVGVVLDKYLEAINPPPPPGDETPAETAALPAETPAPTDTP